MVLEKLKAHNLIKLLITLDGMKTNKNGIPDLIAIPPNCDVLFSEIKKPGGKVSKLQEYRLKELDNHGVRTEVYKG